MPLSSNALIVCALACTMLMLHLVRRRNRGLRNLRGPPAPSRLLGHEHQLLNLKETGSFDFESMRQYGATWLTKTYFGVDQVMTVDPKALQHILHKSGYNYQKRTDIRHMLWLSIGPGIIWADGAVHQRHRKVMNPAFSAQQLRTFLPIFQRMAAKLIERWTVIINEKPGDVISVNHWFARAGLDIIGKAAFDYNFGALEDAENPLAEEYSNVFRDIQIYPTPGTLLYRGLWQYLPESILRLTKYTPMTVYRRMRRLNEMFAEVGRPLYNSNAQDGLADREGKRDAMSVLMRANNSENEKARLDDEEVLAQMHHLTVAGHETTSNALTWLMHELATHPEYQGRMRAEIRAARAAVLARGDTSFTVEDLDGMELTLAAIKETLRFHPILFHMWRVAVKDDVIPLSEPITGVDGTKIHEIPITAGTPVMMSISGYNRLPQLWGEDADRWNPERFFNLDTEKHVKVGVFANLITFSGGVRGCIGWRFALYQLQAMTAELLENFEYVLPENTPHIMRVPAGAMVPIIQGQEELGPQMPLRISVVP